VEDAVIDIAIGTLDDESLRHEWLRPERHSHWDSGIDWVREALDRGCPDLPRHPKGKSDELIEEDKIRSG
jgi:hypothetical protein